MVKPRRPRGRKNFRSPKTRTVKLAVRRTRYAYYELRAFYEGGLDHRIESVLLKTIRKGWVGSGCEMFGKYKRDHEWEFVNLRYAVSAARRLLRVVQIRFPKLGIKTKLRVEVWDTKPRCVLVDGGPK